jgi:hypothetical protein
MQGLSKQAILFSGTSLMASLLALLAGTNSAVYDPSDITSLWQSSTGLTPVSAHADLTGLMLDKAKMNNQPAASFIASQPELKASGAIGLVGTATAATYNTGTGVGTVSRSGDQSNQSYVQWTGLAYQTALYYIEIENTGSTGLAVRGGSQSATTVQSLTSGQRLTVFCPCGSTGLLTITASTNATTANFTIHAFKAVPGYHAIQAAGTQQPRYNVDGALRSLLFDAIDDCLVSSIMNLSGGDEITVTIGIRNTDAANKIVVELGPNANSNNGSFALLSALTPIFRSRGTATAAAADGTTRTPPISLVLTGQGDVSTDTCLVRVNGVQGGVDPTDQGTGNFGASYNLNIGARTGGANPFGGYFYFLAVTPQRVAAITSLAERISAGLSGVSL